MAWAPTSTTALHAVHERGGDRRQDRPRRPRHLRLHGQGEERPERRRDRRRRREQRSAAARSGWPAPTRRSRSRRCGISHGARQPDQGRARRGRRSNVTLRVKGGPARRRTRYRWLMGEDSTAFGGAIRDMWTPTCLGDPGKVTDAEYHCDTERRRRRPHELGRPEPRLRPARGRRHLQRPDGHGDSGSTKAAHLYWRAQSVYQTPTTDFADHADALEASCTDLIGAAARRPRARARRPDRPASRSRRPTAPR